jgi:hypothetical protein
MKKIIKKLLLLFTSTLVSLVLIEGSLRIYQVTKKTAVLGVQKASDMIMPKGFEKRDVFVEGAANSYYWQGKLHVLDQHRMRHIGQYPPKKSDTFRIIIVGDSFTYGEGVSEEESYPRKLESLLKNDYRVEVFNFGVMGFQSEDIVDIIEKYVPQFQTDLIIYGVCFNDFLPKEMSVYKNNMAYEIPISSGIKKYFYQNLLTAKVVAKGYDSLLMKLHLRDDFINDILKNFHNYQDRFLNDVTKINKTAWQNTGHPVVAMVLNQNPYTNGWNYRLTFLTENILSKARVDLVSSLGYVHQYNGQNLTVNKWEAHPGAKAHAIFAQELYKHINQKGYLMGYMLSSAYGKAVCSK